MVRLSVLLHFVPLLSLAQPADSAWIIKAVQHTRSIHTRQVRSESLLYNGADYVRYIPLREEHPYFLSNDWIEGSLMYDGQPYNNILLQYDLTSDQLLTENYNFSNTIQLIKEHVETFTLGNRSFIHLQHHSLTAGYYELLYNGSTKAVARHTKNFQKEIQSGQLYHKFLERTTYFLFISNRYVPVNSKASVLKLFGEQKQEVNRAFKNLNISFSADKARGIAQLARLYDQIRTK